MHWRWWAAALATVTGSVLVAWWVVGFLGFPPWLTALLAVIAALLVLGFVALYVAPYVLGTVDGIRDGLAGRPADEDLLERLRSMTINQVRRRADDFEQRARAAKGGRSSEARENAHIYELPASRWRQLESAMREANAFEVGDLPDKEVERWGARLELYRDDEPWPPQKGPGRPNPQLRTVRLGARTAARGRLLLRRWPAPRVRPPPHE